MVLVTFRLSNGHWVSLVQLTSGKVVATDLWFEWSA